MIRRVQMIVLPLSVILAALALAACSSSEDDRAAVVPPATPGDPAALVGTTWEVGPYVLAFSEPPKVRVSGEKVPIRGGVDVEWSVDEKGIIEIGGYGQHFVGTWDGSALIVRGQSGSRLSGPEPQPAPEDAADQPAPPASDQAS